MNTAQLVGRTLAGLGAGHAFGVVGSGNFEVTNALRRHGVPFVATRHECGAAVMADSYARVVVADEAFTEKVTESVAEAGGTAQLLKPADLTAGASAKSVFDPVATRAVGRRLGGRVVACASTSDVLARSDVVVIATPWKEFAELPFDAIEANRRLVVIDCWRMLPDGDYGNAIEVVRLGRPLEAGLAVNT